MMAIGSSFLVFGVLLALLSGTIINELYYSNYYGNYQIAIAYSQLVGLIFATVGAGMLAYGHGIDSKNPLQSQQNA